MKTGERSATVTTLEEAAVWMSIARGWHPGRHLGPTEDLAPREAAVVGLFDPRDDIVRRAEGWGYPLGLGDLSDLARFGAALAQAESEAWREGRSHVATRAHAERRFLLGDRILHWAVPWLDAVGRHYPSDQVDAWAARDDLLALGELHRPAPALSGSEGLVVPGYDGFGPLAVAVPIEQLLLSLWSGTVLLGRYLEELSVGTGGRRIPDLGSRGWRKALRATYEAAASRWDAMAVDRPGSAQLWRDLANRARATVARLR